MAFWTIENTDTSCPDCTGALGVEDKDTLRIKEFETTGVVSAETPRAHDVETSGLWWSSCGGLPVDDCSRCFLFEGVDGSWRLSPLGGHSLLGFGARA